MAATPNSNQPPQQPKPKPRPKIPWDVAIHGFPKEKPKEPKKPKE